MRSLSMSPISVVTKVVLSNVMHFVGFLFYLPKVWPFWFASSDSTNPRTAFALIRTIRFRSS
jgi:hypothetical protein